MNAPPEILVVEDDAAMRTLLVEELTVAGFSARAASHAGEALAIFDRGIIDAVVTDFRMPGMKGDELLHELRSRDATIPVVIITAFGSIESAVTSIKAGAYHYLPKPFRMELLIETLHAALRDRGVVSEALELQNRARAGTEEFVVRSAGMRRVIDLLRRAAPTSTPVLIVGESGTGKEHLARTLHAENPTRKGRFVAVNCAAIPEHLLESQLFGYRRGAFTDAKEDRRGLFQEADGGTLFLDEIGDLPLALQGKLLRALQEKEVHPLGASAPVPVDVRIVAATKHDLSSLVQASRFREDLYYRLNVITVEVPALRERPEEILPLVAHFLEKHGSRLGREECGFSAEALHLVRAYPWPGNVRELENVVERALILARQERIGPEDLPECMRGKAGGGPARSRLTVAELERDHILRTLRALDGNKAATARILGLDRKTLYRKLRQYHREG